MKFFFWLSLFLIVYTMIGYPIILKLLDMITIKKKIDLNSNYSPKVSLIITAHNEEKVIEQKILNLLKLDYCKENLEIIITSDNSTDRTNDIIKKYTKENPHIFLYEVIKRKGKTNAQNEAVKVSNGDILIFSDANSLLDSKSISEIVSFFYDKSIGYVSGKLVYINSKEALTSELETDYWNYDLEMRRIESDLSSITAGNGALYGVRKEDYENIDLKNSHDSVFPSKMVIKGKRAVFNQKALAYEKAGENILDEFKRKIRMSRSILKINFIDYKKYNFFKYGYFSFFYVSHRLFRNLLFLFHIILFITNIFLINTNIIYLLIMIFQILFYLLSFIGFIMKNETRILKIMSYYSIRILAQFIGASKEITGNSKATWDKAESTR